MAATATTTRPLGDVSGGDSAARGAMLVSIVFLVAAALLGFLAALKLAYPGFAGASSFFSYGRLLPMATTSAVYGFMTFANLAAVYYLLPRLTGTRLWQERLAGLSVALTAALTAVGIISIGFGFNGGQLLAEFPLAVDVLLVVLYFVPLAITVQTVRRRTEENMFISLWYLLAGLVWLVGLTVVGNFPGSGGVASALQNRFLVSGIIGVWVVGVGIGAVYYVLPKATGNPLYSRSLALAGFWSMVFAQLWTGASSFIFGPAGEWIETVSVVFTLGMLVPTLAVLANFIGTLQGSWQLVRDRAELKFGIVGAVMAVFLAGVTGVQGFRSVSAVVGLTPFESGTRYGLIYGVGFLLAASFLYHALPRSTGRELFSESLGRLHMRLTLWGVGGVVILTWLAGLTSGYTWLGGVRTGSFDSVGDGFLATLDAVGSLYILTVVAAAVAAAGQLAFATNLYRTITSGTPASREILVEVEPESMAESEADA